jgi:hypothetical protein
MGRLYVPESKPPKKSELVEPELVTGRMYVGVSGQGTITNPDATVEVREPKAPRKRAPQKPAKKAAAKPPAEKAPAEPVSEPAVIKTPDEKPAEQSS